MTAPRFFAAGGGLVFPPAAAPVELDTLMVHCSDGRFAGACDRFAQRKLQLENYDRLIVPGRPPG